jgi:glycosyltransferase involved in cell wall biosynthesis
MRILYLNPVGAMGGAERCLLHVMAAVQAIEPSAELHLITSTDGPLLHKAQALGVRARLLRMPETISEVGDSDLREATRLAATTRLAQGVWRAGPATLRYARRLRQLIEDIKPVLVHSNGIKTHFLTRLCGWTEGAVLWHIHDFLAQRPITARALRWASKRVTGAIAVSEAVRQDVQTVLHCVPTEVLHNVVDVNQFSPAPGNGRRLDELAGLPPAEPGTLRVGLVATFARWKGQDVFLEAAARLLAQEPARKLRFYIIGSPIYRTRGSQFSLTELAGRAVELGIARRLGFIGFQNDPATVYRALDVVVHASTQPEPFGLTIAEAMACGRPVVVSQAGGAAELFTDHHDALGVPPGNADALSKAILTLLADPSLRQKLGETARKTAVDRFSPQRLGPEMSRIYHLATRRHSLRLKLKTPPMAF